MTWKGWAFSKGWGEIVKSFAFPFQSAEGSRAHGTPRSPAANGGFVSLRVQTLTKSEPARRPLSKHRTAEFLSVFAAECTAAFTGQRTAASTAAFTAEFTAEFTADISLKKIQDKKKIAI